MTQSRIESCSLAKHHVCFDGGSTGSGAQRARQGSSSESDAHRSRVGGALARDNAHGDEEDDRVQDGMQDDVSGDVLVPRSRSRSLSPTPDDRARGIGGVASSSRTCAICIGDGLC